MPLIRFHKLQHKKIDTKTNVAEGSVVVLAANHVTAWIGVYRHINIIDARYDNIVFFLVLDYEIEQQRIEKINNDGK